MPASPVCSQLGGHCLQELWPANKMIMHTRCSQSVKIFSKGASGPYARSLMKRSNVYGARFLCEASMDFTEWQSRRRIHGPGLIQRLAARFLGGGSLANGPPSCLQASCTEVAHFRLVLLRLAPLSFLAVYVQLHRLNVSQRFGVGVHGRRRRLRAPPDLGAQGQKTPSCQAC